MASLLSQENVDALRIQCSNATNESDRKEKCAEYQKRLKMGPRLPFAEGGMVGDLEIPNAAELDRFEDAPTGFVEEPMLEDAGEVEPSILDLAPTVLDEEDLAVLNEVLDMHPELPRIIDQLSMAEDDMEGPIEGPGDETSDSIPAKLSDGEFVFTAKAVKQIGIDKLMKMMKKAEEDFDAGTEAGKDTFADGGFVRPFEERLSFAKGGPIESKQTKQDFTYEQIKDLIVGKGEVEEVLSRYKNPVPILARQVSDLAVDGAINMDQQRSLMKQIKNKYPEEFAKIQEKNTKAKTNILDKLQFELSDSGREIQDKAVEHVAFISDVPYGREKSAYASPDTLGFIYNDRDETSARFAGKPNDSTLIHEAQHAYLSTNEPTQRTLDYIFGDESNKIAAEIYLRDYENLDIHNEKDAAKLKRSVFNNLIKNVRKGKLESTKGGKDLHKELKKEVITSNDVQNLSWEDIGQLIESAGLYNPMWVSSASAKDLPDVGLIDEPLSKVSGFVDEAFSGWR